MKLRSALRAAIGGALVVGVAAIGPSLGAVQSASAGVTAPWPANTVFVADNGMRETRGYPDGELDALGSSVVSYGEPEDVAVDPSGDVFWPDCNTGSVYEYTPGVGERTLMSGLECPDAVAYDGAAGTLLIGSFYTLTSYNLSTAQSSDLFGSSCCQVPTSIDTDSDGDIFFVGGSDQLFVMPDGSSSYYEMPVSGSPTSVRVEPGGQLLLGGGFGDDVLLYDPSDPSSPTVYGGSGTLSYVEGAVMDSSGDVYTNGPGTISGGSYLQSVVELTSPTDSSPTTVYEGDTPRGLAVYPSPTSGARSGATVSFSTDSPETVYSSTPATFTAQVSVGGSPATGYVQFENNGSTFGSPVALDDTGTAQIAAAPPAGDTGSDATDSITALYLGNDTTDPAISDPTVIHVDRYADTVTVQANTATHQQVKKLRVTVVVNGTSGQPTPTGTAVVYDNGDYVEQVTLANGRSTSMISLQPGENDLTAQFDGDGSTNYLNNSDSNTVTVWTGPRYFSSVSGYADEGPTSGRETPITMDVTVYGVEGINPTGTVSIPRSAGWSCGALVADSSDANSTATCTKTQVGFGQFRPSVHYSGDANYAGSYSRVYYTIYQPGGGGGGGDD